MKSIDYVLIAGFVLLVSGVIAYLIKRKKSCKANGCGCGCAHCPSRGCCGGAKPEGENRDETV